VTTAEVIHPTAVVDAHARLGVRVRIGAYAVIGPEVTLEDDVEVGHHVVLEGAVSVGAGARVGHGSIVGAPPQDLKFRPGTRSGVRIGPETTLREYVTVHRAAREGSWTTIGRRCLLMTMSHVAHDSRLGDEVVLINYAGITGHCEIGDGATIGGLTGLVPFTRVGAYAYVGGLSKVTADVPPYVIVEGSPATARAVNVIGLRRAGIGAEDRRRLRAAFRILYRSGLAPASALARIRAELPGTELTLRFIEFIEGSRRGICGPQESPERSAPVPEAAGIDDEGGP
jgi:UDP-N-acetylglucosamine acyltransferase